MQGNKFLMSVFIPAEYQFENWILFYWLYKMTQHDLEQLGILFMGGIWDAYGVLGYNPNLWDTTLKVSTKMKVGNSKVLFEWY